MSFCNIIGEENVISRDKKTIGMELDIVVPQYNIAVEPGNWFLHKRYLSRDTKKRTCCKEKGYRLITVYDKYPKGEKPPFDYDCYVYSEDLNKADHSIIKELVISILNTIGIIFDESEIDWTYIEKTAYENARAKTHEVFVREMRTKMPTIEVIGRYVNANRRIKVKCKQCGFEWNAVPANILRGDGCRKCGARVRGSKERRKQEDFENELKKANPTVNVVGTYLSRHKPIEVQCLKCGNVWNATPSSLLRNDRKSENNGCPVCAKHKIGNLRKRVINVDTGEIFESAVEAGKKYNIVPSAIRQCCRGVSNTSNGYHWKYINES